MNIYPKHYCGIFGVRNLPKASECVYYGLYALQHRGEESSGIVSTDGTKFFVHKGMGLVSQVFKASILHDLKGSMAIGHNRYSTTGGSGLQNAQPLSITCRLGHIALGHNGNLTNTDELRTKLEKEGSVFQTTTDTEVMLNLIARSDAPLEQAIMNMMDLVEGAYSLVIMTPDKLIAVRDPHGFRPLSIGTLGTGHIITSETCALDMIKADFVRDVEPGEVIVFDNSGTRTFKSARKAKRSSCAFSKIYFARPDSCIDGKIVYSSRVEMGEQLAVEHGGIHADMVIPIPDGGVCAALGYARATNIQYEPIFIRNHYVGRSFIKPGQIERDAAVNFKLNLIGKLVKGKRVVIIDDSIVRGTTSTARVKRVKEAGASWVGMLISCPPHKHRCPYGIDFPNHKELIAANYDCNQIREMLGLDYLGYLSEAGLTKVLGIGHCLACFNGDYPTAPKA